MEAIPLSIDKIISRLGRSVTIRRKTVTVDSGGSTIDTYSDHLTGVVCAIFPHSQVEKEQGGRALTVGSATVYVSAGLDITAGDELRWVDGSDTRDYSITGTRTLAELPTSDHMSSMILECEERDN